MAGTTLSNPGGAFGQTASFDGVAIPMVAAVAFTGATTPVAVQLAATAGYVTTAATDAPGLAVGIVKTNASAGGTVLVYAFGPVQSVPVNGAAAQGAILKASATTAGYVAATATPAAGEALGISMAASASNTVTIWVNGAKVLS